MVEINTGNNEANGNSKIEESENTEDVVGENEDGEIIDVECDEGQEDCPMVERGCSEDDSSLVDTDQAYDGDCGSESKEDEDVEQNLCDTDDCEQIDKNEITDEVQAISTDCIDDDNCDDMLAETKQEVVAEIDTGDAQSIVNIINNVNSNIVGDNWMQLIYDIEGLYEEDINLFEYFVNLLENADESSLNNLLEIYNENTANITNAIVTGANTGNNTANDNGGDVNIDTGNVLVGANLVNIVNQNLVGNNWIFTVINVFGLWTGDLIVPGKGLLEGGQGLGYSDIEIVNENNADISNEVIVDVNTGNNVAEENNGDASIDTGDVIAVVNIVDVVNTNIVGDNWFFLMINNMGSWSGNILHWNNEGNEYQSVFSYVFDSVNGVFGSDECLDCNSLSIYNNNNANIQNNITTHVNTGGNIANNNDGDANISTGDATAWVNIFNFINNNIVGNNWMFSVVNIMGEWTGNTIFAYPDLTVVIDDDRDAVSMGEQLNYRVTYQNTGEAMAEAVEVMITLPEEVTYQSNTSGKLPTSNRGEYIWNFAELKPGEAQTFIVTAIVNTNVADQFIVRSNAGVRTITAEVKLDNNYASDQTGVTVVKNITIENSTVGGSVVPNMDNWEIHPGLELSRVSNVVGMVQVGDMVTHQIIMQNTGDSPIYEIELVDKIKDVSGVTIVEYAWDDMGQLLVGESIIIDYAIIINEGINPSEYSFKASASGTDVLDDEVKSNKESVKMAVANVSLLYIQNNDVNDDNGLGMIPEAHASDSGIVLGAQQENNISFWTWIVSILLYILVIEGVLFSRRKKINL